MISCRELTRRSARGEYEGAGWWTRLEAGLHLAVCSGCRRLRRQMAAIAAAARRLAEPDAARVRALETRLLSGL